MLNISIPNEVLSETLRTVAEEVGRESLGDSCPRFKYLSACDKALSEHLGVKNRAVDLNITKCEGHLLQNFSLSTGIGQRLTLSATTDALTAHLRLYANEPIYVNFQVEHIPSEWHELWGLALQRVFSCLGNHCSNAVELAFYDGRLIKQALVGRMSFEDYSNIVELYIDEFEHDDYINFLDVIECDQKFLTALYVSSPKSEWERASKGLNAENVKMLDDIINRMEAASIAEMESNVDELWIDDCRELESIVTLLVLNNGVEQQCVQSNWEIHSNEPLPAVIGLKPNTTKNCSLKDYVSSFMEKFSQLNRLINFYDETLCEG